MRRSTALRLAALAAAPLVVATRRRAAGRGLDDPVAEPPPPLQGRVRTVTTEDGVVLHVEEHGSQDAAATLLLAHGWTQASSLWSGQVRDLLAARLDLKVVVYDHRGHGRSGRTVRERATIAQLGRDLKAVLDAVAPSGPVVIGGHSMGGMAVMALAEQFPGLFGDRVVGVAFLGTSSGDLSRVAWGLPRPVVPAFRKALPVVTEKAYRDEVRKGGPRRQIRRFETYINFGPAAAHDDIRSVLEVQAACTAETTAFFLATLNDHDGEKALTALAEVPALVIVGELDRLCPVAHSRTIAAALPEAELVVFSGAGHMVHLERRPEVSRHVAELVDRALAPRRAPAELNLQP